MEKKGNSATRAKNKYAAANYDRIPFQVKKGGREKIDNAAAALSAKRGEDISRNAYILEAIREKMEREQQEPLE